MVDNIHLQGLMISAKKQELRGAHSSLQPSTKWVAKRKNRTIVEVAKAMMHDHSLPMFLWEEASKTNVYVQNRRPHKILKNMTSEEAFTRVNLEVGHLHIFGSLVYIHFPKAKRTKLEPSVKKGTSVG